MRFARQVGEYYRRQGCGALHYQEQQFEGAVASHRREAEERRHTETARVASKCETCKRTEITRTLCRWNPENKNGHTVREKIRTLDDSRS